MRTVNIMNNNNKIHEINAPHRYLLANYFVQFVNIIEKDVVVSHGFGRNVICIFDFIAAVCEFLFCLTNNKKGVDFSCVCFSSLYTFALRSAARLKYRFVCVLVCWCVCVFLFVSACWLVTFFSVREDDSCVPGWCDVSIASSRGCSQIVVRIVKNTDFRSLML